METIGIAIHEPRGVAERNGKDKARAVNPLRKLIEHLKMTKQEHEDILRQSRDDRRQLEARLRALDISLDVQARGRFRRK